MRLEIYSEDFLYKINLLFKYFILQYSPNFHISVDANNNHVLNPDPESEQEQVLELESLVQFLCVSESSSKGV